jgi:putative intracellular protease/amidase
MNKEIICILLPKYADWEGAFIASSLNNTTGLDGEMFQVKTMSLTKDPVESIGGFKTIPDYDINTLPDKYEALLLIGGMSWFTEEAKLIVPIVESAIKNKILVAGICNASVFLGKYGFLNEVKHTSNTLEYLMKSAGKSYTGKANYINKQAVCDGNIITANGTAYLEFSKEISIRLKAKTVEQIEKEYTFNKLGLYQE